MKSLWKQILFLTLLFSLESKAQSANELSRFEIEADPVAFVFNGYSFHVGYNIGHMRLDAGVFGIKQPDFAVKNKLFSVYSNGIGIKADYLLRKNKGLFLGLQSDYASDKIGLKSSEIRQFVSGLTLGLRTGYRIMFGSKSNQYKGLYLVPWVALIHSFNPSVISESSHNYRQSQWSVFPTFHLGYRF